METVVKKKKKVDTELPTVLMFLYDMKDEVERMLPLFRVPDGDGMTPIMRAMGTHIVCPSGPTPGVDDSPFLFTLNALTVDRLHKLASLLGTSTTSCRNREELLIAILHRVTHDVSCLSTHLKKQTKVMIEKKNVSSILVNRLTSVLFSLENRDKFASLNNIKNHKDIEMTFGRNNQEFYNDITIEVNDDISAENLVDWLPAPESFINKITYESYLEEAEDERPTNAVKGTVGGKDIKKMILSLLACNNKLNEFMTKQTGANENDAFKLTKKALKEAKCSTKISQVSLYYFNCQGTFFPEVMRSFGTQLDDSLLGCTIDEAKPAEKRKGLSTPSSAARLIDRTGDVMQQLSQQHNERMWNQKKLDNTLLISMKRKEIDDAEAESMSLMQRIDDFGYTPAYAALVTSLERSLERLQGNIVKFQAQLSKLEEEENQFESHTIGVIAFPTLTSTTASTTATLTTTTALLSSSVSKPSSKRRDTKRRNTATHVTERRDTELRDSQSLTAKTLAIGKTKISQFASLIETPYIDSEDEEERAVVQTLRRSPRVARVREVRDEILIESDADESTTNVDDYFSDDLLT